MGRVIPTDQELLSWEAGYRAGLSGEHPSTPVGLDGLSYQSGVIEGLARYRVLHDDA